MTHPEAYFLDTLARLLCLAILALAWKGMKGYN
jgi:hypothetical protein